MTLSTSSPASTSHPSEGLPNVVIHAKDIMTRDHLVTVGPETSIRRVAELLGENHISSVFVCDGYLLIGIVSEGDLIHRQELGTEGDDDSPGKTKSRGTLAGEVMTRVLITVTEETSLADVVRTLHANHIRRVPVVRDSRLIGVVARADIVRALAARPVDSVRPTSRDDDMIRYQVIDTLFSIPGTSPWATTVSVKDGIVELNGSIEEETVRDPSRIAIEAIPHVVEVKDRRAILVPTLR
jgi:CBS domain-containing protein